MHITNIVNKRQAIQSWLPLEVISLIISRLPLKIVMRFKCVCKLWNRLICHSKFRLSYTGSERAFFIRDNGLLQISSFLSIENDFVDHNVPYPFQILDLWRNAKYVGNCKGLFLFRIFEYLCLWNPSTNCIRGFLQIDSERTDYDDEASGLCFDESTKSYKVIIAFKRSNLLQLGNMNSKKWTKNLKFPFSRFSAHSGPVVNGNLHWMLIVPSSDSAEKGYRIVYFDPTMNKFDELPLPEPEFFSVGKRLHCLGTMEGCLMMTVDEPRAFHAQVMIMREYGVKESWKCIVRLSLPVYDSLGPLLCHKNGEEYLFSTGTGLFAYNARNDMCRTIKHLPRDNEWCGTYVESLQ